MKDHYALYAIWKALHGDEWSYQGENYPVGSNWDFNKETCGATSRVSRSIPTDVSP